MKRKRKNIERIPIAEWPELERRMGIISRMTSDPPPQSGEDMATSTEDLSTVPNDGLTIKSDH
ncbi:hypothetical protein EU528_08695 [Candidatus Thorarchaeota archaeon]|nr:MAG: hypothetical protein EU528_08695 [Candidatus Thorarchaeota archaeon]